MNRQTVIDLLAAGRVANLPSVVSNVVLGCGVGIFFRNLGHEVNLILPCLVGCLLYVGGCFYNDWADRKWDAENKPDRAIPSKRLNPRFMFSSAVILMLAGVIVSVVIGRESFFVAAGIVAAILLYTWIHKKTAWGVLPMGLCRALLYPLGFLSQEWSLNIHHVWGLGYGPAGEIVSTPKGFSHAMEFDLQAMHLTVFSVGLLTYVAGLSLFARAESKPLVPQTNRVLGILLMSLVALSHSHLLMPDLLLWNLMSLVPFTVFLVWGIVRMKRSVPKGVSVLLANICLVDFIVALPLAVVFLWESSSPHYFSLVTYEAMIFPIVPIVAFLFALLLQRIAPAT